MATKTTCLAVGTHAEAVCTDLDLKGRRRRRSTLDEKARVLLFRVLRDRAVLDPAKDGVGGQPVLPARDLTATCPT